MDNEPTTLFESYEGDFQTLVSAVKEKLEGDAKEQRGEQRKATLRRVEMELDEADEMISQMVVEIQGMPQSIKPRYQTRVGNNKAELARLKKLTKELHATAARSDLLTSSTSPSDDPYSTSASDRARLLAGTSLLEDSTRRLEDSHRIALETEDVGADILRSLRGQREQIEHARDTLGRADTNIDRASGTLKKMFRRMHMQRYTTIAIITVLVILIGLILWFKLS
ncbi:vesicle transport v-snare protein vti1 [Hysterangium stoloniferum]|nr:vesicle transport v-snare protein vti1 [Hysterangium stoloniferum]